MIRGSGWGWGMADCCDRPSRRWKHALWILLLVLGAMLASRSLHGQDLQPYVETGIGRRQGDFGTPVQSTLWLGYATIGSSAARWDANLSVPFLRLAREGGGTSTQDQGLGDIVARGMYRFLPETEDGWSLDGVGALKLPTANDTKGLGTGRSDAGIFLALNQQLGLFRWTVQGGRILGASGDPTGTTEQLTSGATVLGISGSWYFEGTRWGLSFEARGPAYQGLPGARELTVDVFQSLSPKWGIKALVTAGLSDGGPRQSFGVALVRVFP